MIDDLLKYWPIFKEESLMIGDSNIDELAAKKSNLKFKYIHNINKMIKFSEPVIDDKEIKLVNRTIKSGWISSQVKLLKSLKKIF